MEIINIKFMRLFVERKPVRGILKNNFEVLKPILLRRHKVEDYLRLSVIAFWT
jgi:hypothetical protein